MNKLFPKSKQRGVGLVEVIVGSAILSVVLFAFSSSLSLYSQANTDATKRTQALYLAEEALEVVRGLRDISWALNIDPVPVATPRGLQFDEAASTWAIVSSPDISEEFTRTVVLGDVYRDSDDNIVADTSETFDPDTRMVEVEVSWLSSRGIQLVQLGSIITNAFE